MLEKPMIIGIDYASPLSGITVIQSAYCTQEKWNFRQSRYRSKRLHKKLVKRFGAQRVRVPAMFRMMQAGREVFVAHPELFRAMKEQFAQRVDEEILGPLASKHPKSDPLTPFKLRQMALQIQGRTDA